MSGLTATGFTAKTYEEIVAVFEARQRATVDPSLNFSSSGVIANLNACYALELAELWEVAQDLYDAHDPNSAQGIAADHNGALSGVTRRTATKSTVTLSLHLDPHTFVEAGSVVSIQNDPRSRFVTLADVMSGDTEAHLGVQAEAEEFGDVRASADTLTQIDSPASGWRAVTNPAAAVPGHDIETDEAYRARRVKELAAQGGSTAAGVLADVRQLGVRVGAIENETDAIVDGIPPHAFELIVSGPATDEQIAAAIWKNKPAGIQSWGSEAVTITDSEGIEHVVRFTRAIEVPINVNYEATVDATYSSSNGVRAAVEFASITPGNPAYFDVGKNVYLGRLLNAGWSAQGVVNLTMDIARDPAVPADAIPSAVNASITIGPREVAVSGSWAGSP